MANVIARLGVLLGLDTAEFNKGLAESSRKLDAFVGNMNRVATVAAAAFAAMTAKAMIFSDEIADVAQANDVAIDTVVKLQNALANSGGKAADAGKLFASFTNYVDKAAEGSFEAQRSFAKIGISLKDLETLSPEQLFLKTADGIAKIEDKLTQSAKGMEIFGKAVKGVDLAGMADDMRKGSDVTDRQANGIKLLAELYDKLGQASRDLTLNFINILEPAIRQINARLETMSQLAARGTMIKGFFATIAAEWAEARAQATLEEIERLDAKIANPHALEVRRNQYRKEREALVAEYNSYLRDAQGAKQRLADLMTGPGEGGEYRPGTTALPGGPVRAVKPGVNPEEEKRKREEEKRKREEEREEQRRTQIFLKGQRQSDEDFMARQQASIAYARYVDQMVQAEEVQKRAIKTEEQLFNLEKQRQDLRPHEYEFRRSAIQLAAQLAEEEERIYRAQLTPEDREAALNRINEIYERRLRLLIQIREVAAAADADKGTWEGFKEAATEFFKNFPKDMEVGAAMFQSVMGNMNKALDDFVRTGKLNFKEFARSIILDLIAIQLKASAMKMLSTMFGFNIPARAMGGPVDGGSAYVVGERGPELFVPRMSGSIIPNHALSNVRGATSVTNNYINAIDVKSFEQRLMGSSKAIWAANQYAQKGLTVTPGRM